jgi:hypothetical protein
MKNCLTLRPTDSVEALGRVKASLAAGAALTRTCALPDGGQLSKRRESRRKEDDMFERSLTPSITVTIGHHTRIYFAFVTTAPIALDSPATVTLPTAPLGDVAFFAAGPVVFDTTSEPVPARLVLVDALELAWQRAKYRGHQHPLWPADRGLIGLSTLQHWLWQRLQSSAGNQVAA